MLSVKVSSEDMDDSILCGWGRLPTSVLPPEEGKPAISPPGFCLTVEKKANDEQKVVEKS